MVFQILLKTQTCGKILHVTRQDRTKVDKIELYKTEIGVLLAVSNGI